MTTENGGRPLDPDVPTGLGECPVHGVTEFRTHKIGRRPDGSQKYRRRCRRCHAERESDRQYEANHS